MLCRAPRKSLRACYAHAYERVPNFLRPVLLVIALKLF